MAKLLLVEDDENLGFMVKDNLEAIGHEIIWAKNGLEGLDQFKNEMPALCILDIMMPKMDGFELAKNIRAANEFTPILFLTAKSLEEDKLKGFELGADDYLTKPFSIKELSCRIDVFLKRSMQPGTSTSQIFHFGNSSFDPENLEYTCDEYTITLTQMEGKLLLLLLKSLGNLVKREFILEEIWGENDYFKGRSLDVFITRLRKHLKVDPTIEIKNHHGVGFCLKETKKPA